jgi:DNA-binding CsgD family transcriptional regulator
MNRISLEAALAAGGNETSAGQAVGWCFVEGEPYLIVEAGCSNQADCSNALRLNGRVFSIVKGFAHPTQENFQQLTPRELEIALLVGRGNDYKTVARLLMISFYTVRGHMERVYSKLGVHKQSELACLIAVHFGIASVVGFKEPENLIETGYVDRH